MDYHNFQQSVCITFSMGSSQIGFRWQSENRMFPVSGRGRRSVCGDLHKGPAGERLCLQVSPGPESPAIAPQSSFGDAVGGSKMQKSFFFKFCSPDSYAISNSKKILKDHFPFKEFLLCKIAHLPNLDMFLRFTRVEVSIHLKCVIGS